MSSGVLYVVYTLSALVVAAALVQRTGAKLALVLALGLYCFYTASFLVAALAENVKWPAAIIGSLVGGFAAGWLWTAQGAFFARTAELYAQARHMELSAANALLAGIFSTFYIGLEVLCKLLSSALLKHGGSKVVFGVFTTAAVVATCGIALMRNPPPKEARQAAAANDDEAAEDQLLIQGDSDSDTGAPPPETSAAAAAPAQQQQQQDWAALFWRKGTLAMRLMASNPKILMLAPLNMAFGFVASFLNFYINGTIAKAAVGKDNIGYLSASTSGVAAVLVPPNK